MQTIRPRTRRYEYVHWPQRVQLQSAVCNAQGIPKLRARRSVPYASGFQLNSVSAPLCCLDGDGYYRSMYRIDHRRIAYRIYLLLKIATRTAFTFSSFVAENTDGGGTLKEKIESISCQNRYS